MGSKFLGRLHRCLIAIKCLEDWNKALILLHLTKVIQSSPSSLRASWIKCSVLKQNNFCHILIPSDCCWIWRNILNFRPLALQFLSYQVGNGNHFSLWHDPWLNGQSISPTDFLLSNSGISRFARVSSIISQPRWSLPLSNHLDVAQFRSLFLNIPAPSDYGDSITWEDVDIRYLKAHKIWDSIREKAALVPLANLVWFKHFVPRFSFTLWLAMRKRLPTNDLFMSPSNCNPITCPLCKLTAETFEHMFFNCSYSAAVFSSV